MRLPPVQWSGLIVRFLVSALVTRAVYQSDGWILGLCTCHPWSTRSRVRFCVCCHFTGSMPPLSSRFFKPTPTWRFDTPLQTLGSSFCFSGFQAGSFRAMLSFILLLWFALCVLEAFLIMRHIQRCHALLSAEIGKRRSQTKTADNAAFDAWSVWLCAARAQTNVWQTAWHGKGNNLRTSRRENHSTQHDRKHLKRHIETSRHCGRKEKQGQRRARLLSANISKTQNKLLKHLKDTDQTS